MLKYILPFLLLISMSACRFKVKDLSDQNDPSSQPEVETSASPTPIPELNSPRLEGTQANLFPALRESPEVLALEVLRFRNPHGNADLETRQMTFQVELVYADSSEVVNLSGEIEKHQEYDIWVSYMSDNQRADTGISRLSAIGVCTDNDCNSYFFDVFYRVNGEVKRKQFESSNGEEPEEPEVDYNPTEEDLENQLDHGDEYEDELPNFGYMRVGIQPRTDTVLDLRNIEQEVVSPEVVPAVEPTPEEARERQPAPPRPEQDAETEEVVAPALPPAPEGTPEVDVEGGVEEEFEGPAPAPAETVVENGGSGLSADLPGAVDMPYLPPRARPEGDSEDGVEREYQGPPPPPAAEETVEEGVAPSNERCFRALWINWHCWERDDSTGLADPLPPPPEVEVETLPPLPEAEVEVDEDPEVEDETLAVDEAETIVENRQTCFSLFGVNLRCWDTEEEENEEVAIDPESPERIDTTIPDRARVHPEAVVETDPEVLPPVEAEVAETPAVEVLEPNAPDEVITSMSDPDAEYDESQVGVVGDEDVVDESAEEEVSPTPLLTLQRDGEGDATVVTRDGPELRYHLDPTATRPNLDRPLHMAEIVRAREDGSFDPVQLGTDLVYETVNLLAPYINLASYRSWETLTDNAPFDVASSFRVPGFAVGRHSNGSLNESEPMPQEGPGYLIRSYTVSGGKNYSTGMMIRILQEGFARYNAVFPDDQVVVGNLSKSGGGQMPGTRHRSHQSGLDVDISFAGSETPFQTMTDANGEVSALFRRNIQRNYELMRNFTGSGIVQWIFVNKVIKKAMCEWAEENDRLDDPETIAVLSRVWPWSGHRDHMHVRFFCPPGGHPLCQNNTSALHKIEDPGCDGNYKAGFY